MTKEQFIKTINNPKSDMMPVLYYYHKISTENDSDKIHLTFVEFRKYFSAYVFEVLGGARLHQIIEYTINELKKHFNI